MRSPDDIPSRIAASNADKSPPASGANLFDCDVMHENGLTCISVG